jgi:hypothetical protein
LGDSKTLFGGSIRNYGIVDVSKPVTVRVIAKGTKLLVFLDSTLLTYFNDCAGYTKPIGWDFLVSGHETTELETLKLDNNGIWDLDQVGN